ncbi:putative 3'-5' exonuclease domain, ribonuclease H-like superfamily [Plasmopara halstedii]
MPDRPYAEIELEEQQTIKDRQETLAELFEQMRLEDALHMMRVCDSIQLSTELSLCFSLVPQALSIFLQCVDLYCQLPDKNMAYVSLWIETAVACIEHYEELQISLADSQRAGSLLLAFKSFRMSIVAQFALAYRVKEETLSVFCSQLIEIRVGLAARLMECLKKKDLLPTDVVLEACIKQKDFSAGDMFVKNHRGNQQKFVQMLIDGSVPDKVIKKRLSLFKLPADAFPVYFERRQKAFLSFLIHSKEYEQALQFAEHSEILKLHACNKVIRIAGVEDAATQQFIFRSGLKDIFPEVDTSAEDGKAFENQDDLDPNGMFLSLVEVISEASIVFVDTPIALQACVEHLIKQPAVGFDSEWKAVYISDTKDNAVARCALLQLASCEKVFVVDVMALHEHGSILAPLFLSKSVIKLAFDAKSDAKHLRSFLTGGDTSSKLISMLVDLQVVAKKLAVLSEAIDYVDKNVGVSIMAADSVALATEKRPKKRQYKVTENDAGVKSCCLSLAAIAKFYLGRPLDKRARMSNWERRPLSQAQLHYAALDAHVLLQIYSKMQEKHSADVFDSVLSRCTQKCVR